MKVTHQKRLAERVNEPLTVTDISAIGSYIHAASRNSVPTSKYVADVLMRDFINLLAVPVTYVAYDGAVELHHWVNVTVDGSFLIDATGDRFNAQSFRDYSYRVTPWVYRLYPWVSASQGNGKLLYFSYNHAPQPVVPDIPTFSDASIVEYTSQPWNKDFRCICIDEDLVTPARYSEYLYQS